MAILCESDKRLADTFSFGIGQQVLVVDGFPMLSRALDEDPTAMLVVIGPDADLETALAFTASKRTARPELGVVLIRHRLEVGVLSQAIRAGVREVVAADDLAALGEACHRSLELSAQVRLSTAFPGFDESAPARELGRVVTVFAAKGGCGKTTLATNLAVALAQGSLRRVCLVDLDLAFGDVAITMQLHPGRSLVDALAMADRMDETGARSLLTRHSSGLDTILAPAEPGGVERVPGTLVAELLRVLRTMFEFVVVDTPPALSEHVLAAFDASDHYALVTTPDIAALKNLRITLDTLDLLGYSREARSIVLNRADAKVGVSAADVEQATRSTISARIPSSRDVPASMNRGVPIVTDQAEHPVSLAIRDFARDLLPQSPAGVPEQAGAGRRGFGLSGRRGRRA
jgi:pilus assembly protein CpaE